MQKVLVLLVAFIAYVNYQNYIKPDIKKLHREVATLNTNIAREIEIQKKDYTKKSLLLDYSKITFDAKEYSYSKAMGAIQDHINESAKDLCTIRNIKWAQSANTKEWYDKMRMNVRLYCKPNELMQMTNRLKSKEIIYNVENFSANKNNKKAYLDISIQLVGFRTHDDKTQ